MEDDTLEDVEGVEILVAKDQLIVVAHADATKAEIVEALQEVGGSIVGEIPSINTYQVELPPGTDLAEAMEALEGSYAVESAFPNVLGESQQASRVIPNDTWFKEQSDKYLSEIRAAEAWEISTGSKEVTIAIVDTGVDEIDFDRKIVSRFNIHQRNSNTAPLPPDFGSSAELRKNRYHGTVVAGVAAAKTDNEWGMAGISWESSLAIIKTENEESLHSWFDLASGIDAAIDSGAKVINISGGTLLIDAWLSGMEGLIRRAKQLDILIVVAGANNPKLLYIFPAAFANKWDNVIAVGSTDKGRFVAGFGTTITVSAPDEVAGYAPFSPDRIIPWRGTSFAAPQVSGLAALIWSLDYETNGEFTLRPAEVRDIIVKTAKNPKNYPWIGAGVIDARSALERTAELLGVDIAPATPEPTPQPAPTPTTPSGGAAADRVALVALYNATDGSNWAWATEGWLTGAPIGEWEGVGTNSNGRVNSLWLAGNRLNGELSPDLGNLLALLMLYLPRNSLTGEIPSALENLSNLQILSLHQNRLSGQIPAELGNLPRLETLRLNDNRLSGQIPPELGSLANLEDLDLSGNRLSGEIPLELGNLANLEEMYLSGNRLTGCIPEGLRGCAGE